jgi:hypothetical protein
MGGGCANFDDAYVGAFALTTGNDIATAGSFCSSIDFGTGPVTSFNGKQDAFATLLHAGDGSSAWGRNFNDQSTAASTSRARGVAVAIDGHVLVTGGFETLITLGSGHGASSTGGSDIFVAEFTDQGTVVNLSKYGSAENQEGASILVDSSGDYFLLGIFEGSVDFGGGALVGDSGTNSTFVARFARQPAQFYKHDWSKAFGAPTAAAVLANGSIDNLGNLVLTGFFRGDLDFGSGTLSSGVNVDIFLAKLDGTGKGLWARRFDDPMLTTGAAPFAGGHIAVLPSGESILAGVTPSPIDFGTGTLTPAGGTDIFVAKFGL